MCEDVTLGRLQAAQYNQRELLSGYRSTCAAIKLGDLGTRHAPPPVTVTWSRESKSS